MLNPKMKRVFTPKQMQVMKLALENDNWNLMILYGAKRSGKTFINNYIFMYELFRIAKIAKKAHVLRPQYILAGVSSKSLARNILVPLYDQFGISFKIGRHNQMYWTYPGYPTIEIDQAYDGSIDGLKNIKGMTAFGAYINECSESNERVFQDIRDRCSGVKGVNANFRVIADTNPSIPTHWLKRNYIDNPRHSNKIVSIRFTLMDNKTKLNKSSYDNMIETTPKGIFYERNILGLWTTAQGTVFNTFDPKKNVINSDEFKERTKNQQLYYYGGVDFGFAPDHHNSIVLLADDDKGNTYLVRELTEHGKYIDHYAREIKALNQYVIRSGKTNQKFVPYYCDSARPEYVQYFDGAGIHAYNANKNIMDGIEYMSKQMTENRFFVVKDGTNLFLPYTYTYVWNERTGKPLKKNDDPIDATRYGDYTHHLVLKLKEQQQKDNGMQLFRDY